MTAPFRIERGIPLPPSSGRRRLYPLDSMEPGDSFLIPGAESTSECRGVYSAAENLGVQVRLQTEEEGVRVWLVSKSREATP